MAQRPDPLEVLRDLIGKSLDLQETIQRLTKRATALRDEILPPRECCPCPVLPPCTCTCHSDAVDKAAERHIQTALSRVQEAFRRAGR